MSDRWPESEKVTSSINKSYKSFLHTKKTTWNYPDFSKWLRIELPESQTAVTSQVVHECAEVEYQKRMGNSKICATETSADPDLAKDCVPLSHPSGGWSDFFLTGKFFWLWRDGESYSAL